MKDFEDKNVLITGATGLIGANLVKYIADSTDSVRMLAMGRNSDKLDRLTEMYPKKVLPIVADVSRIDPYEFQNVDYIFHLATTVDRCEQTRHPVECVIMPNLQGTMNVLNILRHQVNTGQVRKSRAVIVSSSDIYPNRMSNEGIVSEEDTFCTERLGLDASIYPTSKRMSEVLSYAYYREYGVKSIVIRPSSIYGESPFGSKMLFDEFIRTLLKGEDIHILSSELRKRDNLYVEDCVKGIIKAVVCGKPGEAYNVSSDGFGGGYASVDEIALCCADEVNRICVFKDPVRVIYDQKDSFRRMPGIRLDNAKIRSLGWKPEVSLTEGIRRTIEYYKDNMELNL